MTKSYSSGIAFAVFVAAGALVLSSQSVDAAESMAKKKLMDSIDNCEMLEKTDAREDCMDEAWAAYKEAHAAEAKAK